MKTSERMLEAIIILTEQMGAPPTNSERRDFVGLKSASAAHIDLNRLKRRSKPRIIRVLKEA
ncbi:hypothetical protein JOD43_002428 [Pullulanibacillus pueri]|uniref:Uncharacterized protein n=1 Tax=Pullulanibacillus pueri TaxID=1437324 RepID=A0A8J2ZVQ1_9BACL|nr:transcriptional regulator [Pullulanibacillus pueri]MBM7682253.1 hypothetical protein [Pullulanibacillus pueri]GGH81078.1 hypothetical protein GCM10007096_18440 [Pullulanibacillus pueri]